MSSEKLDICVKSKFFKEVSAANVFGDQPIKRDNSKLLEVQEKLKKTVRNFEHFFHKMEFTIL